MDLMSNMGEYQTKESPGNNKPRKTWFLQRGKYELFVGGWVSCCWVPKRDEAGWSKNCMLRCNALKNGHLPERKDWALYRKVVSCCRDPKKDDAKNEKSNYKTDEGNRKGKYKHFVWCNLMYKKVFSFFGKSL